MRMPETGHLSNEEILRNMERKRLYIFKNQKETAGLSRTHKEVRGLGEIDTHKTYRKQK